MNHSVRKKVNEKHTLCQFDGFALDANQIFLHVRRECVFDVQGISMGLVAELGDQIMRHVVNLLFFKGGQFYLTA